MKEISQVDMKEAYENPQKFQIFKSLFLFAASGITIRLQKKTSGKSNCLFNASLLINAQS